MKTTVLIPYIGKLPLGFRHFVHSASFVKGAEFLFLTDNPRSAPSYPNFRVIPFSLSEFNARAKQAVGCELGSNHSMKICDFRPAFGLIFADLFRGSDFWGYCDTDVMFGNIATYVEPGFLSQYDVISMNANYLSGSFTLWRNDANVNRLFEQSPDWRRLMLSPELHAFDECGYGLWPALNSGASIFDVPCDFQSMTHVVRRLQLENRIRAHFRGLVKEVFAEGEVLKWSPGHVSTVLPKPAGEYPYFHSVLLKNLPTFYVPSWNPMPLEIYISHSGYHRNLAGAASEKTKIQRMVQRKIRNLPSGLMRRFKKLTAR